jgi:glycosyltransferase involved in cell wall biosynthesis
MRGEKLDLDDAKSQPAAGGVLRARDDLDVSVVISTYNRADVLPHALHSLLRQAPPGLRYDIVVVDNNSTDSTRAVVEGFIGRDGSNLRYVFEPRQGLAHGRNTGVLASRAPIIAFTDDDVTVAPDWIATIKRTLDEHPEADCVGGPVLSRGNQTMPRWLTREHWSPLALLDYGNSPFYVTSSRRLCLIGANTAFRRSVFDRIGLFAPRVQSVKREVGTEDHEFLLRLWRLGRRGLYVPPLVVTSDVARNRLTKGYHRPWHRRHGRLSALMNDEGLEETHFGRLFGVPAWIYREILEGAVRCLGGLFSGNPDRAFLHEVRFWFSLGFVEARWREFFGRAPAGTSNRP